MRKASQQASKSEGASMKIDGLCRLSEIPEESTEWLWPGRIPFGEITIIEGDPGTNKSSLTYDIAARLTKGVDMPSVPPHRGRPSQGGAVFMIGEDSLSKTVKGRLLAAGADVSQIGVLEDAAIPDDVVKIEKAIYDCNAKLVVIDTLNDFLHCNVLSNQSVRNALRPLAELANRTGAAVVMLRHFNKSNNGRALYRGGGSGGITALARSQLKLYRHPKDPHMRVLVQDKSNLGSVSPNLLFEIVSVEEGHFRLEWHGPCQLTVDDLERKHRASPKSEAAEHFLLEKLAHGRKVEAAVLIDQAKNAFSKRTLDEAKKTLGVKTHRKGKGRNHEVYWSL